MKLEALEILRCAFCGGRLIQQPAKSEEIIDNELETGMLGCACCAYPVVAGIPYLRMGRTAREALRMLDDGKNDEALRLLLGLAPDQMARFESLRHNEKESTYRAFLELLSPNLEGTYFLFRFSDPTFLVSDGLLRALAASHISGTGPLLDLCGGSGHLTRTMCEVSSGQSVWLADLEFWKLWLARHFVAPRAEAVCCDASQPLPFRRGSFALTFCSDAFHFIWPRRSLAGEMRRLVGPEGLVIVTQLHNALCKNPSEGAHLEPEGWRNLFEEVPGFLFKESAVLDSVLQGAPINLSARNTDDDLASEPALLAVSTASQGFFREYQLPEAESPLGQLSINPLYYCEDIGPNKVLSLRFPSAFYESEFGECRRYLPERLALPLEVFHEPASARLKGRRAELAQKRILLNLPENYL